jgi:predicted ATPase
MRITSIEVKNFKSLNDFRIEMPKFCCLVGLNGAGKSTVLQCIDFLAQLARGDLDGWFRQRLWKPRDVPTRVWRPRRRGEVRLRAGTSIPVTFALEFAVGADDRGATWAGTYDVQKMQCTSETIRTEDAELRVEGGKYAITEGSRSGHQASQRPIEFEYQGSILSQLRAESLPTSLKELKQFLVGAESLELLAPHQLRRRARVADGSLGDGGRNLSAFVHDLSDEAREELEHALREAYPNLLGIVTWSTRGGWKTLRVLEHFGDGQARTESRHVNDGMLRLMAILAELRSDHGLLLFDEIENGINPELVKLVVTSLVQARQQVIATTHSPLILNYLDDEAARRSVILLYKTPAGDTHARPLFAIPSLAEKLKVMGPGEAFVDTDLVALSTEAAQPVAEA